MTDLEALKLVNKEIERLQKELDAYRQWKEIMLEMCLVHEHNQELLSRVRKK